MAKGDRGAGARPGLNQMASDRFGQMAQRGGMFGGMNRFGQNMMGASPHLFGQGQMGNTPAMSFGGNLGQAAGNAIGARFGGGQTMPDQSMMSRTPGPAVMVDPNWMGGRGNTGFAGNLGRRGKA